MAPSDIAAKLAGAASQTYISPALLSEAAIHQLIDGGHLPGNIARVTELMRVRRDAMIDGCATSRRDRAASRRRRLLLLV